jgi:YD repeat-containing protein
MQLLSMFGLPAISLVYNPQGRLTQIDLPGFEVDLSYNSFNKLTEIRINGIVIAEVFYSPQGQFEGFLNLLPTTT